MSMLTFLLLSKLVLLIYIYNIKYNSRFEFKYLANVKFIAILYMLLKKVEFHDTLKET